MHALVLLLVMPMHVLMNTTPRGIFASFCAHACMEALVRGVYCLGRTRPVQPAWEIYLEASREPSSLLSQRFYLARAGNVGIIPYVRTEAGRGAGESHDTYACLLDLSV